MNDLALGKTKSSKRVPKFREIGGFLDFDKNKAASKSDVLDPYTGHYSDIV